MISNSFWNALALEFRVSIRHDLKTAYLSQTPCPYTPVGTPSVRRIVKLIQFLFSVNDSNHRINSDFARKTYSPIYEQILIFSIIFHSRFSPIFSKFLSFPILSKSSSFNSNFKLYFSLWINGITSLIPTWVLFRSLTCLVSFNPEFPLASRYVLKI